MRVRFLFIVAAILFVASGKAQQKAADVFTHADTVRGSITKERAWWDLLRYDLFIKPDYTAKSTEGKNTITYKVVSNNNTTSLQLDLQAPLVIDSIILNRKTSLSFTKDGNAWFVKMPSQQKGSVHKIDVYFSGKPHEAIRAPWDGGWSFVKDSLGRPWMTVTCQGLGSSIWFPCKDHQSDEPDKGASLTMTVPDTLVAIANGRMQLKKLNGDGTATYKWAVVNPINNYCLIPYIGKYVNFKETYNGEKGKLDLTYWVLDYNEQRAKNYMPDQVHKMFKSFEHWFGPYPFYEDGYQLVETSHTGMEHQSAVSYGNWYKFGYRERDFSGTGWGMKFDFIIIHESGHEWFGNNITTKDLADMWVHEGFTNYSETLFVDYIFGKDAANAYNHGIRNGIRNDKTIIPAYGVNAMGSGDMYPKGGNLLHSIRHSINNDEKFRQILRSLNKTFYHKTVTSAQVEKFISEKAGFDYSKVFDQYLRTIQIPTFEFYFSADKNKVHFRYTNCVKGFNLPLSLNSKDAKIKIFPTDGWKELKLTASQADLFTVDGIEKMYYVNPVIVEK
ncbi:M1 family metallopeptidase [Terrimonas alba]|uniref:M1 family metallopeptidase n=1 Tax=Terrimonas alba TaxID=3349636 RepID=UPI0035F464E4